MKETGYGKLQVYEKSYKSAIAIYRMTENYANTLKEQMQRASMSIPLNIAEGYAKRSSQKEFKRFLMMAIGSANEMSVLLDFAKDLGYLDEERYTKAYTEYDSIGKMLNVLIRKIETQI